MTAAVFAAAACATLVCAAAGAALETLEWHLRHRGEDT